MSKKRSPRLRLGSAAPLTREREKETGFSYSYVEFAKTLRTWFVAYGIGAPVLALNQESLRNALTSSGSAKQIAWCFLAGVGVQILAAFTYKVAMWYLYMGELDPEFCATRRYRISEMVSVALWLEVLFDAGTLGLFAWATFRVLDVLVP